MPRTIHVYCDESCHLENDGQRAMVLGALWCPSNHRKQLVRKIRELKRLHGLSDAFEIKWVKVSPAKLDFYKSLIDLFFDERVLGFRALVVPDKGKLNHLRFNQSHDEFYYKQWYTLLNRLVEPRYRYRIFLDIKDTHGVSKVRRLHDFLCNGNYDFNQDIIESLELVHSSDLALLQLADLLIGALAYLHRGLLGSGAKSLLVNQLKDKLGANLEKSTLPQEKKFNLFIWRAQD
ncbi:hypothetical protein AXK11_08745 [Cephaloticoccus primus]|uniref:DUF3800 domain-containing protein n=2 Tax=Cephaloticoccus primus TaxID=1548207 RepID=A0A139SHW2_9BACT|nr:hypothetical protein AXK11_08745 [Cephaloticoccus primus]